MQSKCPRATAAQIDIAIVLPLAGLMPLGAADAFAANEEAAPTVFKTAGLLQWIIVNPLQPWTCEQATDMLVQPQCLGIKIHPEELVYPIREHEVVTTFPLSVLLSGLHLKQELENVHRPRPS